MTNAGRARIREVLSAQRQEQIDFLTEIVRVPADNPPGDCAPHAARTATLLTALGFDVAQYPVPDKLVQANGMVSAVNLVIREHFGPGPTIALSAHGDVVPPGDGWSTDPYGAEIKNGAMYGRGVAVSKSDFATYAFALRALKAIGGELAGTVELHLTYDEEAGGRIGPQWLLEERLTRPDYVIYAGASYGAVTAHNGCLHLEVELRGRSAHAAHPADGDDALLAATAALSTLYEHRDNYMNTQSTVDGIGCPTLVVGLIEGGINTNVVPDKIRFRLDRRIIPDEDPEEVERELTSLIEHAVVRHPGIRCTFRRIMLARPFKPVPGTEVLVDALRRIGQEVLDEDMPNHGVPIFADARHYAAAGIPTVMYGAGPRILAESHSHGPDERLVLADLWKATEVVALTVLDILGLAKACDDTNAGTATATIGDGARGRASRQRVPG